MKICKYGTMKETLNYMQEMDISKEDRRDLIQDCYGCVGSIMGIPYLLESAAIDTSKKDLKGVKAKNALEKSLEEQVTKVIAESEKNNGFS